MTFSLWRSCHELTIKPASAMLERLHLLNVVALNLFVISISSTVAAAKTGISITRFDQVPVFLASCIFTGCAAFFFRQLSGQIRESNATTETTAEVL